MVRTIWLSVSQCSETAPMLESWVFARDWVRVLRKADIFALASLSRGWASRLSTEACAICDRCAILDGLPCRHPDKMHPCVESHGINVIPVLEQCGMEFQYGQNVVTWMSLLFF